jgi:membrane protein DedA with SNARE-associated domain
LLYQPAMSFDVLANLVLAHGYLVVFVAVALDCAALPIPGELLLLTIGGLAFRGHLDPVSAIAVAVAGVIIADGIGYWAGRLGGQRVLNRVGLGRRWTPGITTLVLGRFVIGARVVVAPMAGARRLSYGRFVACDAVGALLWSTAYVLLGYGAGANLGVVQQHWKTAMTFVQIGLTIAVVAYVARRLLRTSRLRLAVGAALIALFSLRAATLAIEEARAEIAPPSRSASAATV